MISKFKKKCWAKCHTGTLRNNIASQGPHLQVVTHIFRLSAFRVYPSTLSQTNRQLLYGCSGRTVRPLGEAHILWLGNDVCFVKIALKTNKDFLEHVNHCKNSKKKATPPGVRPRSLTSFRLFWVPMRIGESHGLRLLYTVKVVCMYVFKVYGWELCKPMPKRDKEYM